MAQASPLLPNIESNIFHQSGDKTVYIGGEKITDDLRGVLRDEARYIQGSRLWEILSASIEQEAVNLALIQSTEWDHVLSAKQLHHYRHFVNTVIHLLTRD